VFFICRCYYLYCFYNLQLSPFNFILSTLIISPLRGFYLLMLLLILLLQLTTSPFYNFTTSWFLFVDVTTYTAFTTYNLQLYTFNFILSTFPFILFSSKHSYPPKTSQTEQYSPTTLSKSFL